MYLTINGIFPIIKMHYLFLTKILIFPKKEEVDEKIMASFLVSPIFHLKRKDSVYIVNVGKRFLDLYVNVFYARQIPLSICLKGVALIHH